MRVMKHAPLNKLISKLLVEFLLYYNFKYTYFKYTYFKSSCSTVLCVPPYKQLWLIFIFPGSQPFSRKHPLSLWASSMLGKCTVLFVYMQTQKLVFILTHFLTFVLVIQFYIRLCCIVTKRRIEKLYNQTLYTQLYIILHN